MIALNVHHPARAVEDVDVLLVDAAGWRSIADSVIARRLGGIDVPVIGRPALIAMKRASGRAQDLADADALEQAEERDG